MYRNQDVSNLRTQPANVLLNEEWIHRSDSGAAISCECRFAHVIELRIAKEAELNTIPRKDDGLASLGEIVSAANIGNAGGRKSAQCIEKPSFFRVKGMVIGYIYEADPYRPQGLCELLRRAVQADLTGVIGQSALAIDKD